MLLSGGCPGGKVTPIDTESQFQTLTVQSEVPVLVDFYKAGCATCIPLDGIMDTLAEEYRGRAVVAKFELMSPVFIVKSGEIKDRHNIDFFPTTILFVNGKAVNRWVIHYNIDDYRRALDDAIAAMKSASPRAVDPSRIP